MEQNIITIHQKPIQIDHSSIHHRTKLERSKVIKFRVDLKLFWVVKHLRVKLDLRLNWNQHDYRQY